MIGIILAGICLGNVLGGRLADRVEPRRAVGPLFALGSLLTLCSLWVNAKVGLIIPNPDQINWELRTVLVVVLDFLVPATVLGMVGPVVAKMAVEQARKAGSAIGDVYFWGAMGSIAGTFLCGFVLMLSGADLDHRHSGRRRARAPGGRPDRAARRAGRRNSRRSLAWAWARSVPLVSRLNLGAVDLGSYQLNYLVLAGNAAAVVLGIVGLLELIRARRADDALAGRHRQIRGHRAGRRDPRPRLTDLAILAFVASLAFMALEMVAGRLVQRHLGSSIYGWTSVIGVLLAGLSFGNFLGGKIADFVKNEKQASWLFLAASVLTLGILLLETQPKWFAEHVPGRRRQVAPQPGDHVVETGTGRVQHSDELAVPDPLCRHARVLSAGPVAGDGQPRGGQAGGRPAEKLQADRDRDRPGLRLGNGRQHPRHLSDRLSLDRYVRHQGGDPPARNDHGLRRHHCWARSGMPSGRACPWAFVSWHSPRPPSLMRSARSSRLSKGTSFEDIGKRWGIREQLGSPDLSTSDFVWVDESNYYYIKVENQIEDQGETQKRTLVLDNLIHGYFILDHPERLDYDYEHIYALVAYRAAKASGNVKFKTTDAVKPAPSPRRHLAGRTARKSDAPKRRQPRTTRASSAPPKSVRSRQAKDDCQACRPKRAGNAKDERYPQKPDRRPATRIETEMADRGAWLFDSRGRAIEHENTVPGRRGLLLSAPYAVCLPGNRRRRRRDRHPRDGSQFPGHRAPQRHADQDLLGRRPPVRRAQPGQQTVRPGLRRRVQRLLGPLAPDHPRIQRQDQKDAHSQRRLHDQHYRRL